MMFLIPIAASAKKALSLRKDIVFRLMFVMMVLLGWLISIGAGSLIGLENLYSKWQLEQSSRVNIYLMAESSETQVVDMTKQLRAIVGVEDVERMSQKDTLSLLAPYFDEQSHFPLPIILDVTVKSDVNREELDRIVYALFPTAEIDDARYLLESVERGVRLAQTITLFFAVGLLLIMALLVSLTVRAALRGQIGSLSILQYIGATDAFIVSLVSRQVLKQSLLGWVLAVVLGALSFALAMKWNVALAPYLSWNVWIGVVASPLFLAMLAVILSWFITRKVVRFIG